MAQLRAQSLSAAVTERAAGLPGRLASGGDQPLAVSPDGQVVVLTNADGSALPVPVVDGSVSRTYRSPPETRGGCADTAADRRR